jgi:hypothetical protein
MRGLDEHRYRRRCSHLQDMQSDGVFGEIFHWTASRGVVERSILPDRARAQ